MSPRSALRRNLLEYRPVAAVARSRFFPAGLQWITTLVFAVILWQLVLGPTAAHDNLGTALTWVLWWPLIPIVFLAVGRFWCAVCPFGWLSDQVQKLVGVGRPVPAFLKRHGIWIIDASFIGITWADHVWGIVESPWGSGILLLLMTTAVVATAALFQRRAFCRYVCFIGGLAGNYSRAGMVQLRADTDVCATCTSRAACFNGTDSTPPCPLFEFPRKMETSANCTLCASCIKSCPNDAIQVTLRPPSRELWFIRAPKVSESFLAAAIMGIVLVQNVTMLGVWADTLRWLESVTGSSSYALNYSIAFVVAISAPVLLLVAASRVAAGIRGGTTRQSFARFGYALIPLDVAAHIAHNLFHLLAEGKSVYTTAASLVGIDSGGGSAALLGNGSIHALQVALIVLGLVGSVYTAHRIARASAAQAEAIVAPAVAPSAGHRGRRWTSERLVVAPYATLIVGIAALNLWLFAMPMSHRM